MENPSPSRLDTWTFGRVMWATLVLVLVALGFWVIFQYNGVLFTVFIAIVLGTVIRPMVDWLYRHRLSRLAGSVLTYLLILAFIISFLFLLFPLIAKQGTTIVAEVPGYYQSLRGWIVNSPIQLLSQLGQFLPNTILGQGTVQQTGQQALASAGQAIGYAAIAANGIFMAVAMVLLAFHWTLNGPRTIHSLLLLIPKDRRESTRELITAMETKVSSYIAGQGILCLVIGLLALVAYVLIGLPNALVLALVAGVLEAVPMLGPLLGAVPAALVALSIAPSRLVWVIVATVIIQQLENSLLVPRVMRQTVGVNPFVSLLAFFAFSSFFGIAGALMAIPMAAIIQLLLDRFVFHPTSDDLEAPIGRDYTSRLRYEAQDLAQDLRRQARLKKGGSALQVKQTDAVMDEIEAITTDLDSLLAHPKETGVS